jgi:hypothetical protein
MAADNLFVIPSPREPGKSYAVAAAPDIRRYAAAVLTEMARHVLGLVSALTKPPDTGTVNPISKIPAET